MAADEDDALPRSPGQLTDLPCVYESTHVYGSTGEVLTCVRLVAYCSLQPRSLTSVSAPARPTVLLLS
jgi:hypothetical protein